MTRDGYGMEWILGMVVSGHLQFSFTCQDAFERAWLSWRWCCCNSAWPHRRGRRRPLNKHSISRFGKLQWMMCSRSNGSIRSRATSQIPKKQISGGPPHDSSHAHRAECPSLARPSLGLDAKCRLDQAPLRVCDIYLMSIRNRAWKVKSRNPSRWPFTTKNSKSL